MKAKRTDSAGSGKMKLKTLYLNQNGTGKAVVVADTLLRGVLGYGNGAKPPNALRDKPRIAGLFALLQDWNAKLSYVVDWREAFLSSPELEIELCNINNIVHFGRCLLRIKSYDLIVVSHVAAGDDLTVLNKAAGQLARRRCPIVMFIGNEYDILDDKLAFIKTTGTEFVCSQLPITAARYLYQGCNARVIEMPHALNPGNYHVLPGVKRDIDIGFIGDIYWPFVGDRQRTDLIEWFEANGSQQGLRTDIRRERVSREDWNIFLNNCHAIIGAESGTYYLNERGKLLDRARAYNLFENRTATFAEVYDRFFRDQPREVSGKSISSRHFEPIGTKTCQILIEGFYNGILMPDVHYISVKKDLSNISEALLRFKDGALRERIADETYTYVMDCHTYERRVAQLLQTIGVGA